MSEACQHCYAEEWAKRFGTDWGKTADRRFFGDKHWNEPVRWNAAAEKAGNPRLVFCASMADVFEDRDDLVPHRERLWDLIGRTPWLTWQLLTKRPENIAGMVPWSGDWPVNVWAGTTVETQRWANERIPLLCQGAAGASVRFLSCEPLFDAVDLGLIMSNSRINWVITGGESGPKARPSHPAWFRSLRDQCQAAGVPFLFKQWGSWRPMHYGDENGRTERVAPFVDGVLPAPMAHVGKKLAGHVLDGRTWDEMPEAVPACP